MSIQTANLTKTLDSSTWQMVKRLVRAYLRPYLSRLWLAVFFMLVAAAMTAVFAWLMEPVFDKVLVGGAENLIVPMGLAVFACFLLRGLATYAHKLIMNQIGQHIVGDIQRDLCARLLILDMAFFVQNPSGQLVSRIVSDVTAVRGAVSDVLMGVGRNLITLIFLIGLMFYQDWKLAVIAFMAFPAAAVFVTWIGRRLRKISKNVQAETASLLALLVQIFQGVRQVKAYGTEAFENRRASDAIERVRNLNIKSIKTATLSAPFNETLLGLAVASLIIYGGFQVSAGTLSVGVLSSFIAAFALAYEPMKHLAKLNNTLQIGLGAAERIFEVMDLEQNIKNSDKAVVLKSENPSIIFDGVTFFYHPDEEPALQNISFVAPAGMVTALVGASGSGKTTIMNMVPRLYDATNGSVHVGSHDVRDVTIESLRAHIALVSQDVTIFDDTIRANIAYGMAHIDDDAIINAARTAAADDFIRDLPDGYDTRVGEHGVRLSGGQKQRIAIARAVLRDAPILLLDEATSALDNESEKIIQHSLEALQKGRTVLVIAHRLSTVQKADQIIVLAGGKIVETGQHKELIAMDGVYARMYRAGMDAGNSDDMGKA